MSRIQTFDFSVDLLKAILWQYNEAPRLQALLTQKKDWYDLNQTGFWENWTVDVFDLRTANDFGLQVWAIILDLPLIVDTGPPDPMVPTWGYEEFHRNYNNGNFFGSGSGFIHLTTEQARIALRLRYFQMIGRGTIPEINNFMNMLFGVGQVYALDGLNMTMQYVFKFVPSSPLLFVLRNYDLLPRPAAVGIEEILILPENTFGFETHENFEHGNFGIVGG